MSRKTISFQNPSKSAIGSTAAHREIAGLLPAAAVDQWVHEPEEIGETTSASSIKPYTPQNVPASVTISISVEPDAFELIKMGFLLPYLMFWYWSLGVAKKNLHLFGR
jgi:hypothetical protein